MSENRRTWLITGADKGLGFQTAKAALEAGDNVVVTVLAADGQHDLAADYPDRLRAFHLDARDHAGIGPVIARAMEAFGRIDILVSNAAVFTAAPVVEIGRADYARVFDINVAGTLFTMQAVARHMIERGGGGKIINMASQAGRRGEPLVAVYCATKAAVISLTQSAGLDLIKYGINVNAIAPGVVDGEHWDGVDAFFAEHESKLPGQKKKEVGEAVPFGRMGKPEDLTGMAVFLASREADYIVAQTYNVDGGNWMN